MGNVLHVIFRYFIDTPTGVVRFERLLLHKGDANNVLPTAFAYHSVSLYTGAPVYRSDPNINSTNPHTLNANMHERFVQCVADATLRDIAMLEPVNTHARPISEVCMWNYYDN